LHHLLLAFKCLVNSKKLLDLTPLILIDSNAE
jgi:hypothetical protein